jgi:hypothetical protein
MTRRARALRSVALNSGPLRARPASIGADALSEAVTSRSAVRSPKPLFALARVSDLAPIFRKGIDAECGAKVDGRLGFSVLNLNACGIRDTIDGIEGRRDCSRVDQCRITHLGADFASDSGQTRIIAAKYRIGERHEQCAVTDVAIASAVRKYRKVVILAGCFAALTEQDCMRSSSIKTLIEDRDTARNQFNLRMCDGAKFAGKISHPLSRQVLSFNKLEPSEGLFRYE